MKQKTVFLVVAISFAVSEVLCDQKCQVRNLGITVDNVLELYVNGVQIPNLPNYENWERADSVPLTCYARVIAVKGTDHGVVAGILASTDDGYIQTNSSWKCTNQMFLGWETDEFDDSSWAAAYQVGIQGTSPWRVVAGISTNVYWIWTPTDAGRDPVVYCRKVLIPFVPDIISPVCPSRVLSITVDNMMEIYKDGEQIENLPNYNVWRRIDTVALTCNTRLIAVKGTDLGRVAGILASTDDDYVLSNASWKCTNEYFDGWEKESFDDSTWPAASVQKHIHVRPSYELVPPLRPDARWIWTYRKTPTVGDMDVYCRKDLVPHVVVEPVCTARDLSITVDASLVLYIDGVEATNLPNADDWGKCDSVKLPCDARVIAVQGTDEGDEHAGILASTRDGFVLTNSSWKCTNVHYDGWESPTYDDSDWPLAYAICYHVTHPWGVVAPIRADAYWIWTSQYKRGDRTVYCRKKLHDMAAFEAVD